MCLSPHPDPLTQRRWRCRVPGDLISDLEKANLIGDPFYETNWRNATLWDRRWSFSTKVTLSDAEAAHLGAGGEALLVFDGIKMGAKVEIDGTALGLATDQWYSFSTFDGQLPCTFCVFFLLGSHLPPK